MHPGTKVMDRVTPCPTTTLKAYDGSIIHHYGIMAANCRVVGSQLASKTVKFFMCDTQGPAILGLSDSKALDLVTINPLVEHVSVSHTTSKRDALQ